MSLIGITESWKTQHYSMYKKGERLNAWTTGTNVNFSKIDVMRILKIGIILTPCTTYVFWRNPPLKNLTHPVCIARSRSTHALHSPFSWPPKIQVLSSWYAPTTFFALFYSRKSEIPRLPFIISLTWQGYSVSHLRGPIYMEVRDPR